MLFNIELTMCLKILFQQFCCLFGQDQMQNYFQILTNSLLSSLKNVPVTFIGTWRPHLKRCPTTVIGKYHIRVIQSTSFDQSKKLFRVFLYFIKLI